MKSRTINVPGASSDAILYEYLTIPVVKLLQICLGSKNQPDGQAEIIPWGSAVIIDYVPFRRSVQPDLYRFHFNSTMEGGFRVPSTAGSLPGSDH
jgi:hypothetical protein